jgi:PiT family inorganic phosphate transporter
MMLDLLVAIVILMAFVFLLTNGLNDASSVVATIIACGAATPAQAVTLAAVTGLAGAILGGEAVTHTIVNLMNLPPDSLLLLVLLAAVAAAMGWNVITWHLGLPSSSTHALVGGLIGAVWAAAGGSHIAWGIDDLLGAGHQLSGVAKVVAGLLISPVLGFMVAALLQKGMRFLLRDADYTANHWLKRGQWLLAGLLAFTHGSNDTQKTLGLVVLALIAGHWSVTEQIPLWSKVVGGLVMFTGTLFGGWSIMKTLGRKIFRLRPLHSFNSLMASGGSLLLANALGAPISTAHLVAGTVIGVGAADEYRMVNWHVGKEMAIAWVITIPATAAMAGALLLLLEVTVTMS